MIELCRNTLKDEIQVKYYKSLLSIYFIWVLIRFPFHNVSELAARRHGKQTYPRPRFIQTTMSWPFYQDLQKLHGFSCNSFAAALLVCHHDLLAGVGGIRYKKDRLLMDLPNSTMKTRFLNRKQQSRLRWWKRATRQKNQRALFFKDASIKTINWKWRPSLLRVSGARLMTFRSPLSLPAHRCPSSNLTAQFHSTEKSDVQISKVCSMESICWSLLTYMLPFLPWHLIPKGTWIRQT